MSDVKAVPIEYYTKMKRVRQMHLRIRLACTITIFLTFIALLLTLKHNVENVSMINLQTELAAEVSVLTPKIQRVVTKVYEENQAEIHTNIKSVFLKHQPDIKRNFEAEAKIFIAEFPQEAATVITTTMENNVLDFLEILRKRYPKLEDNEYLGPLAIDLFDVTFDQTNALVEKDAEDIGQSLKKIYDITQSDKIVRETDHMITSEMPLSALTGVLLRMWAREFPGGKVEYTTGSQK